MRSARLVEGSGQSRQAGESRIKSWGARCFAAHHECHLGMSFAATGDEQVDFAPPPNQKHRCFWVVRLDGSQARLPSDEPVTAKQRFCQEDFSARKCRDAIRQSPSVHILREPKEKRSQKTIADYAMIL